jgi:hypothetical protein
VFSCRSLGSHRSGVTLSHPALTSLPFGDLLLSSPRIVVGAVPDTNAIIHVRTAGGQIRAVAVSNGVYIVPVGLRHIYIKGLSGRRWPLGAARCRDWLSAPLRKDRSGSTTAELDVVVGYLTSG